ncbi:PREDICTED: UPF0481 protein At3g47200-like [Nelumbo nucifera]|uniref:UPF0481 protein At3g47200-like n=2 Tax=Nelumbo nucifera TaxID=4432 RepID=A0A1U8BB15_NELNU|nr:PREDICTED: UPF0481 protein At3g47200-like [Nelumbo nucifera]DAD42671.1 TPA_asm: hypothetical protein HUJ06_000901 [Nelumbo nucifera]
MDEKNKSVIVEFKQISISNPNNLSSRDWLASLVSEEDTTAQTFGSGVRIGKVPSVIREKGEKSYDPKVVAIGPYHHSKHEYDQMEKHKTKMVRKFISLLTRKKGVKADDPKQKAEALYQKVDDVAQEAKLCYEKGSVEISDDEFNCVMFTDGCFVVYFIHCMVNDDLEKLEMRNDHVSFVENDLFLLENQLPFSVIRALMSSEFPRDDWKAMINKFVKWEISKDDDDDYDEDEEQDPFHLLDLLRTRLLKSNSRKDRPQLGTSRRLLQLGILRQLFHLNPNQQSCPPEQETEDDSKEFLWQSFDTAKELKAVGDQLR